MIIKQKYFLLFFLTLFFSPLLVFADDSTSTATSTLISSEAPSQVLGLQAPALPVVIQQINNAKALLADVSLNHELIPIYKNVKNKKTGKTAKTLTGYQLGNKDIALAILDPATNNIIINEARASRIIKSICIA